MRASSILLGSLGIAAVLAGPVDRRVYTTEVSVVTVTKYVTLSTSTETPQPTASVQVQEAKVAAVTTTTPAAAVVPAPVESSSPAPAPTTMTTVAPAPSPTAVNTYQSDILYNHNIHRSNHSANSLTWSTSLENSAAALANKCYYQHDTYVPDISNTCSFGYLVRPLTW